jgi:beta-mannosidase
MAIFVGFLSSQQAYLILALDQWNVWHGQVTLPWYFGLPVLIPPRTQEPWHNWDILAGRFVSEFGM